MEANAAQNSNHVEQPEGTLETAKDFDLAEEFQNSGENVAPSIQTEQQKDLPEEKRQTWNNRVNFLLASLGAAIGFGNFFRFPYLVYSRFDAFCFRFCVF